jgi:hypothetical protein
MAAMTESTWQDSFYYLRGLSSVPAALANATTLLAATPWWSQRLVARTSSHDLLFTRPGDGDPFRSRVRVQWAGGTSTILRWQDDALAEEAKAEAADVDSILDGVLERLAVAAAVSSAHIPEEPRDSLVEELIDDLMASELGQQADEVQIDRIGPGVLNVRFDQHEYRITVGTKPWAGFRPV